MWRPCFKHTWGPTSRSGIYRCTVCWAAGYYMGLSVSRGPASRVISAKAYTCPICKGPTPGPYEVCPKHLPDHPLHEKLQEYDHDLIEYMSLEKTSRALLHNIFNMGEGPYQISVTKVCNHAQLRSLHKKGYLEKHGEGKKTQWSLTAKALKYLEEVDDCQQNQQKRVLGVGSNHQH